jgi:potassium/hydrogen antiporter
MENAGIIVFVGLIIFVSHLFTGIFEKKRIPDVLLLMMIGLLMGPLLGLITPNDFGIAGSMFTTITLVIILFEGGLTLRFETLKNAIRGTTALTMINFFVTMVVVGLIGWVVFGLNPIAGFMLGAILGGTSSAVVIPMVQQLRIKEDTKTILVLESAVSDVLCIIFALALLETFHVEEVKIGLVLGKIISSFTLAAVMGWIGALVWSILLNKVRTIRNTIFTTPAFVFIIFGIAEMLGYSGAISALAFGITLANIEIFNISLLKKYVADKPITLNETEKVFFGEIVFLLKTFFFIYIGLSIQLNNLWALVMGLILSIVIFSFRVPVVKLSIRKPLPTFDLTMISVMVPKGLAAAVLASLPFQQGIEGGELIRDITYAVILISIVMTSVLIPTIERSSLVRSFYGLLLRKGFLFKGKTKILSSDIPEDESEK